MVKISELTISINAPKIAPLFLRFLCMYDLVNERPLGSGHCTEDPKVMIVRSATCVYFPLSNRNEIAPKREILRATPSWKNSLPSHDTVLVKTELAPGLHGLLVARLHLLFSFMKSNTRHDVALIQWYSYIGDLPDEDTEMWVVKKEKRSDGLPVIDFIYIDAIVRSCQLLPVYRRGMIPHQVNHMTSLNCFQAYYVNKFADHHSFELLS